MSIEEKREYLLKKLLEKEELIDKYERLTGPGLSRKIKKLFLLREKYLRYSFAKIGILRNKEVKAKTFWGREMVLLLLDSVSLYPYYFGTLQREEFKLTRFIIKNLKKDDIFYDIGANYGFYSLLAQEIIKEGEIHAFEPHPKIFTYLKKIIIKDGAKNIFLNNFAVSNKNKAVSLFDGLVTNCSGTSTTLKEVARSLSPPLCCKIKTKAITLDKYIKRHTFPTFIKLDIEGAEPQALEGAYNVLKRKSPIIVMEVWGGEDRGNFSRKAVNFLRELGYSSYSINGKGDIIPVAKINFNQIGGNFDNFIFKNIVKSCRHLLRNGN